MEATDPESEGRITVITVPDIGICSTGGIGNYRIWTYG